MEKLPEEPKSPETILATEKTKEGFVELVRQLSEGGELMGAKIFGKSYELNSQKRVTVYYNKEREEGGNDFPEAASVVFETLLDNEEGDVRAKLYRISKDGNLVFEYDSTEMPPEISNTRLHEFPHFNEDILKKEGVNLELVTEAELQDVNNELSGILQTMPKEH